ncbi:MAG: RagB/SusD family nutrient uptake outer membrane protein [Candidatus Azobacteroides sp.]|nr:RagB/SusD family nutrient uptake outer membrane protein [Candidatus Azobacteroides sp.]
MKNTILFITTLISSVLISGLFYSCEDMMGDFLEKPPGVDVSEDTIFSSADQARTFLYSIYEFGIHSNLSYAGSWEARGREGYANPEATMMDGASDEAECVTDWYFPQFWNQGTINANRGQSDLDGRFNYRFKAIRMVTILLDRIDDVPDMSEAEKKQLKAEVKVIRAMNYLEMFKRYGGVLLIRQRLSVDDDLMIPRSNIEELVDFIVQDCDEAIPDLPVFYTGATSNLKGRVHKGVAHAIKSKTLLYAASPLFNTGTPYLSLGENNHMICYGDYKKERWERAAEAAKDALVWSEGSGCRLITDQGVDNNYQYTWDTYDNDEIILAEKSQVGTGRWIWPWGEFSRYAPPNKGYGGTSPTFNFVKKYEKKDGTLQTWTPVGVEGNDLQEKMAELDNRFKQTVLYNMGKWNANIPVAPLYEEAIPEVEQSGLSIGGTPTPLEGAISRCYGGFWLHKNCPYVLDNITWSFVPNSTIFQLNEIYLNYAEAVLEAYGSLDAKYPGFSLSGRDAINIIRERSGQPKVLSGSGAHATERDLVRNERDIELAFSNHRFWDIRRWMIAEEEGVMKGKMLGLKINLIDPDAEPQIDRGFKYIPYVFEDRVFFRKMYLHPFQTDEVNKGYLVQNPGY